MTNISHIKDRILKRRGIRPTRAATNKQRKLQPEIRAILPESKKTPLMKLLEIKYHDRIENILSSGSLKYIEKKYGVDFTTASKWRKLLAVEALRQLPPSTIKSVIGGMTIDSMEHGGLPEVESASSGGDNL